MSRRGNKSHKVPNVKLRPAAPQPPKSPECWVQETQPPGSDDGPIQDSCPRPFSGMVFCATGTLDKMSLFKKATELGGKASLAFTDLVTHLIASDHGGAKYTCALERKIPILKPSFITENYEVWLRGDDVDPEESMPAHRHPIFTSIVLCISGIDNIDRRVEINKLVTAHGGAYRKELQRPVDVTHLLCSGDETTDKMHYAEKFNQRGEADIKLVWEEWFWDCLEFGGRFEEEKYLVKNQPRPERRRVVSGPPQPSVPDTSTTPHQSQLAVSRRPSTSTDRRASGSTDRRTLGSTASADNPRKDKDDEFDDEESGMANTNYTALRIWESLLKVRGYAIENNRMVHSPSKASGVGEARARDVGEGSARDVGEGRARDVGEGRASDVGEHVANKSGPGPGMGHVAGEDSDVEMEPQESVLSTLRGFRKQNSFVVRKDPARVVGREAARVVGREAARVVSSGMPMRATTVQPDASSTEPAHSAEQPSDARQSVASGSRQPVASGSRQPAASGSRPRTDNSFLAGKRFSLAGEADSPTVRNALAGAGGVVCAEFDAEADFIIVRLTDLGVLSSLGHARDRVRTECWVEKCVYEKRVCDAGEHLTFTPLSAELLPVSDASSLVLSFSGLDQAEACWIRRLLKAFGITHAPTFTRRTTHLLCPSRIGKKFEKAPEWGIKVVDMAWLRAIARDGRVPKDTSPAVAPPVNGKGKGRMEDITSETTNIPIAAPHAQAASTPLFANGSFGQPDLLIPTPDVSSPKLDNGRVPSSATPSPMKEGGTYSLPRMSSPSRSLSASPQKPPDTSLAKTAPTSPTKSASGSRSTSDSGSGSGSRSGSGSGSASPSKGRSPMRRKRSSHSLSPAKVPAELQASIATLLGGNGKRAADVGDGGPRKRPKPDFRAKARPRTPSPPPEESYAPLEVSEVEESMRVVYADAEQQEEKRKLMRLLGASGQGQGQGKGQAGREREGSGTLGTMSSGGGGSMGGRGSAQIVRGRAPARGGARR
ncbi:hypothetical protein BD626DRAFT_636522 [Schizophyllum amplum]|uniref:BRCT domain-containing protein n=1 Tax=Schizophyllum amplum TaxID=97359 RepID=A0A550BT57_9AGAR|nr:hypothetical protein BD626DRAFT_636522 [Auriculariopsis ampla]